ncbi:MAG: hypothetical protein P9L92_09675, partial [Candidatus Electryonea clarkiae]|nr:hypothetical protein [Candidatus Electryonea clarkiae]MDP8285503.1 hypothetical protein [Candidatus Electryonea clarkiae]
RNRQTPLNKCSVLPMGRTALNKQNKNGNSNCRWREIIVDVEHSLADHEDPKVRRLASEGCRPRLPWAMALPAFKKDPTLILPILEKLKNDESETVRRSVANNLNDISKDNPEIVLAICNRWMGKAANIDKLIKHACRSLLKAGNKETLLLFGFGDPTDMNVENLKLSKYRINIGDDLNFSFDLIINQKELKKVRLEYCIYYMKANVKLSKKVFQITENSYKPGEHSFRRKQSFKNMTTRKHYPGKHKISIIVNGEEKDKTCFELGK